MSRGDNQLPRISFDDDYRVRVLEKENIAHTQDLETESNQFSTSTRFPVQVTEQLHAERIELSALMLTSVCVCVSNRAGGIP